jgi:hypothetical protein
VRSWSRDPIVVAVAEPCPAWIARHDLTVGELYVTKDSDLTLEYLGYAQVRDRYGFRYVMVFREMQRLNPMLTLSEADADACSGFRSLGDQLGDDIRDQ